MLKQLKHLLESKLSVPIKEIDKQSLRFNVKELCTKEIFFLMELRHKFYFEAKIKRSNNGLVVILTNIQIQ